MTSIFVSEYIATTDADLINGSGNRLSLKPSNNMSSNINFVYPPNVGSNTNILATDGAGNTSWSSNIFGFVDSTVYLNALTVTTTNTVVLSTDVLSKYDPNSYFNVSGTNVILTLPIGGVYLFAFTSYILGRADNGYVFFEAHNSSTNALVDQVSNVIFTGNPEYNPLSARWIFDQRLSSVTYNFQYYHNGAGSTYEIDEPVLSIIRLE